MFYEGEVDEGFSRDFQGEENSLSYSEIELDHLRFQEELLLITRNKPPWLRV